MNKAQFGDPENAPIAVFKITPDETFFFVNDFFVNLLGYDSSDKLINKRISNFIVDISLHRNLVSKLQINGNYCTGICTWYHKNGSILFLKESVVCHNDTQTNSENIWIYATDVTEYYVSDNEFKNYDSFQIASIFKAAPIGIGLVKDRVIAKVNDKLCEMLGYSADELIGKSSIVLYPSQEQYQWVGEEKYRQIAEKGTGTVETQFKCKNGKIIDVLLSSTPLVQGDNSKGVTFTALDITKRREAEKMIADREERFQRMLNNIPDMISIIDPDMNILYSNWKGLASVSEEKRQINTKCYSTYRNLDNICPECQLLEVKKTKKLLHQELLVDDGKWLDIRIFPLIDKNGNIEMFMEWIRDISIRKNTILSLEKSEKSLRTIIENLPFAVFAHNFEGKILIVNRITEFYTGYTRVELLNMQIADIDPMSVSREDRENIWLQLNQGTFTRIESIHKRKNGSKYDAEITITAIMIKGEQVLLGIVQDITERKLISEKAKQQNKQLKELNASKDKFFSIIAHDLRAPIAGLLGFSENLVMDFNNYSISELLETTSALYASSLEVYKLLNNLLEWSRMNMGNVQYNPDFANLHNLAGEAIELLFHSAQKKEILIDNRISKNSLVFCDLNMISLVFRNLLSNAIKYSNQGGKIVFKTGKNIDNFVEILITDTGVGIEENSRNLIFSIDSVYSTPGTSGEKGSGLGLLLCREYVQRNGGRIWVESEIGKGSTFYFTLPIDRID